VLSQLFTVILSDGFTDGDENILPSTVTCTSFSVSQLILASMFLFFRQVSVLR
jgi:hypothetical protein